MAALPNHAHVVTLLEYWKYNELVEDLAAAHTIDEVKAVVHALLDALREDKSTSTEGTN